MGINILDTNWVYIIEIEKNNKPKEFYHLGNGYFKPNVISPARSMYHATTLVLMPKNTSIDIVYRPRY